MTREEAMRWLKVERKARTLISECQITEALDMAIEALSAEAVQEWIPVSERLPKERKSVLITDGDFSAEGEYAGSGRWMQYRWSGQRDDIIAWMPLPEPYREDGEV